MIKSTLKRLFAATFCIASFAVCAEMPEKIILEGKDFRGHVQGVCTDGTNVYWSMSYDLVKTDASGKELARYTDKFHMGDLCWHAGRIYVGVNRKEEKGARRGDEVWVFEPERLERVKVYPTPETLWCNNGIEWYGGRFWIVGGTPVHSRYNYVFEYTEDFRFVQCRPIDSGWTLVGVQTVCLCGDKMLFGCYGSNKDPVLPHPICTFAVDVNDLARKSRNIEFPYIAPIAAKMDIVSAEGMFVCDGKIWTAHGINPKKGAKERRFGALVRRNKQLELKLSAQAKPGGDR